jgi:hypothetical protein
MFTKEELLAVEDHIRQVKTVSKVLAIHDSDRTTSKIQVKCGSCHKKINFPIVTGEPLVAEMLRCPICDKIECMCFINIIVN